MPPVSDIEKRKIDHIKLCSTKDVAFHNKTTLFEAVELNYKALPEVSMNEVDLSTEFLGKKFDFPFMVSGMTGGAQVAKKINLDIAAACQEMKIGMGVGSMRAMFRHPSLTETYFVRDVAPDIFLAGNLGMVQLKEYSVEQIDAAMQAIEANALAVHVNAAQEAVQPEGDADFSGVIERLIELSDKLSIPVYIKEVGHGISYEVALALKNTNVKAIDVQGSGGTSWTGVEAHRVKGSFGATFWEFGIPTAVSLIWAKSALHGTDKKVLASGGIRTGLDAVKAITLGADLVGAAMPILKAQQKKGTAGVVNFLTNFKKEMVIASALVGCVNIQELHEEKPILLGKLKEWLHQ